MKTSVIRSHDDRDFAFLKDTFIEKKMRKHAPAMAADMGLEWVRTLEDTELATIAANTTRTGWAQGVSSRSITSFPLTDLVMKVRTPDLEGEDYRYVVVEASSTGDRGDVCEGCRRPRHVPHKSFSYATNKKAFTPAPTWPTLPPPFTPSSRSSLYPLNLSG